MKNENAYILLVEDNSHEAMLAISCLQEHGLSKRLHHVSDGAEALDFIFGRNKYADREIRNFPKVILLDLNMPKVGGLEVLRQIKSNELTKAIPVVILSSSKQDRDIVESYKTGVNSYIAKPVDFDSFSQAVAQLGMYWMLLNEAPVSAPLFAPSAQ